MRCFIPHDGSLDVRNPCHALFPRIEKPNAPGRPGGWACCSPAASTACSASRTAPHCCRTDVRETNTPFMQAVALRSSSRNCSPAPDLVLRELVLLHVLFSGGVFFSQTPVPCRIQRIHRIRRAHHLPDTACQSHFHGFLVDELVERLSCRRRDKHPPPYPDAHRCFSP